MDGKQPHRFEKWYSDRYTAQLTRIVRCVKAWADKQSQLVEMPKGVALTVLAATHYCKHERDDVSLVQTLMAIETILAEQWHCKMPVEPFDNLLRKCKGKNKHVFQTQIGAFIKEGN